MKKSFYGVTTMLVCLFTLSACGTSPRDEFAAEIFEFSTGNQNQLTYEVNVEELGIDKNMELPEEFANLKDLLPKLNHTKIAGKMLRDDQWTNSETTFTVGDTPLTVQTFTEKKGEKRIGYFPTKVLLEIASLIDPDTTIQFTPEEKQKIETSYIANEEKSIPTKKAGPKDKELITEFVKTLPKDSFKKENEVITHTFTKKEWADFFQYTDEKAEPSIKPAFKKAASYFKELDSINDELSINVKTKEWILKHQSKDKSGEKLAFTAKITAKKTDKKPEPLDKSHIISEGDVSQLLITAQNRLSPEDFDALYNQLAPNKEFIDPEEFQKALKDVEPYLLPEQKQKLDDLLK